VNASVLIKLNASVPRNDTKAEADGPHSPTLRRLRGANKR
jgi:hypothetical protein